MTTDAQLDRIAGNATCSLFAAGAGLAATAAVYSIYTGQIWGAVAGGAGLIAAEALSELNGCNAFDPSSPYQDYKDYVDVTFDTICLQADAGVFTLTQQYGNTTVDVIPYRALLSIGPNKFLPNAGPDSQGMYSTYRDLRRVNENGVEDTVEVILYYKENENPVLSSYGLEGATCGPQKPPDDPDNPLGPPNEQPDPEGGPCKYRTRILEAFIDERGILAIKYETETYGGVGCSGKRTYWYKGPGVIEPIAGDPILDPDGNPITPPPPGAGPPTNCPEIPPIPNLGSINYKLTGICEAVSDDAPQPEYNWAIGQQEAFTGLAARIDSLALMLQTHLELKTPICGNEQPTREGDFRTINFRSAEASPYSSSRLRKRFRYRSTSGLGLGEVVDHWKDFTFQSGPVVVGHIGSSWGTPQVWASSENEGKRVIRHAAGEAGIDPDQVGRWRVGSSNSSRYGVSDTMSVDTEGGFYRITSRDGSDGRPIVAKDIDL